MCVLPNLIMDTIHSFIKTNKKLVYYPQLDHLHHFLKVALEKPKTNFHCKSGVCLCYFFSRPAFLPDPNDGSLYSLGGKNNEGLTVGGLTACTLNGY